MYLSVSYLINFKFDNLLICNSYDWHILPHIVHCLAKLAKSSVIKERTWINQRKTYAKGIFVNKCMLFVHIQPTEVNLHSHFGNISSNFKTTRVGYQCNSITLIQSYQDCT